VSPRKYEIDWQIILDQEFVVEPGCGEPPRTRRQNHGYSAMCLNSSPDLLFSYLSHLESRGLSEQYTEKIDEYIGKYLKAFKEVSFQSAETFLHRSVHLMPRTRARYSTYLRGFLGHYGI
jgi:hypothetical protein